MGWSVADVRASGYNQKIIRFHHCDNWRDAVGRWANKYVIGLTGNIGMGKSLVRKMAEHLGAYTIDADGLAHQVMAPGAPAYIPVLETFGKWIMDSEKRIDRGKLGAVAFSHPEALARLEALTHPI